MEDHGDRGFTAWYGVYVASTHQLRWAGGGHPPGLLIRLERDTAQLKPLESQGPMLGMIADETFQSDDCQLNEEDRLLLYTDGVFELESPDGKSARLKSSLSSHAKVLPAPHCWTTSGTGLDLPAARTRWRMTSRFWRRVSEFNGHDVVTALPAVLHMVAQLHQEKDSQPADRPLVERGCHIGRCRQQRIERNSIIGRLHANSFVIAPDACGQFSRGRAAVRDEVDKQLFENHQQSIGPVIPNTGRSAERGRFLH